MDTPSIMYNGTFSIGLMNRFLSYILSYIYQSLSKKKQSNPENKTSKANI
jgi:hypothetical protein